MTREAVNDAVAKGIVGLTRDLPEDMGLVLIGTDTEGNITMRATLNLPKSTLIQVFNQLARSDQDLYRGDAEGRPTEFLQPCSCAECRSVREAHN